MTKPVTHKEEVAGKRNEKKFNTEKGDGEGNCYVRAALTNRHVRENSQ